MSTSAIVITGANRGIGLELTRLAAKRGDRVVACCRQPDAAGDLHALRATHPNVEIHALTVNDADSVAALAARLEGQRIDVLVNNAGTMGPTGAQQSAFQMDYDGWAETFAINTIAPVRLLHALRPNLERADFGKAVTITSQMGAISVDMRFALAYCASKAAVNKVMRLMAPEFAEIGIVVSLIHPGWVRTDMGGADADIAPEESATGILAVIDGLGRNDGGTFFSWNGEPHPW